MRRQVYMKWLKNIEVSNSLISLWGVNGPKYSSGVLLNGVELNPIAENHDFMSFLWVLVLIENGT